MKRAFVTGGSGFVGSRLIPALRGRGVDVTALARSESSTKRVEALGATSVRGDLDAVDTLQAAMRGCDVVFHAAATPTSSIRSTFTCGSPRRAPRT